MGIFSDYSTLGSLDITCYDNYDYIISNSFNEYDMETVFFLFLVDKVMADTRKSADVDQMLAGYLLDIGNSANELKESFSEYTEVKKTKSNVNYSISQELRSKSKKTGKHLYINTSFDSFWAFNADKKSINSILLYVMDIKDRFPAYKYSVLRDRFSDMLRYYDKNTPPSATTITDGPTAIVNKYSQFSKAVEAKS